MAKRRKKAKSLRFKIASLPAQLQHINFNAAGIDIGSERHMVAVPEGRDEVSVREFGAFTADLEALAAWLKKCGVTSVAMESTGVYWIPLFELLERRGFEVKLVDARHVKNVSGRKSDVLDCQWIQQLHTYGLLAGAFRPPDEVCVLRSYLRQKEMLRQTASMHIQHMQKALQQMNLLLHNVVSDITGVTGMKIIKAILAGERDPRVLARNRSERCKHSSATIAKSLIGNYREEHLFALQQAVDLYEMYQAKIADCDQAIIKQLEKQPDASDDEPPSPDKPIQARDRVRDGVDVRDLLFKKTGVDLFAIPGLAADTLLTLASEVGFDMTPWKTEKHFSSWLGLCPGTRRSGGKVLDAKTKRNPNRAAQAFRMAASSLYRSQTALGAFHRRIKARSSGQQAVTATAHKIARIYYAMLTKGTSYIELGQQAYEQRYKQRRIDHLNRQAKSLGFQLVPCTT
ncbi:MAG TPA: IS110 family transposase [Pyrinomonadaceae bacterium]|nr:IS110 family transposase [Pyrinomonadaceae bacterium]